MPDLPLHYRSATDLGRLIATKQLSSVELTRLYLDRLDTHGRTLNALAELTRDLALQQAKQADDELAAGKSRGPLHGVPYGAKDLLATANIPTRWGSPAHADQVFDYDATVITRLREAGCVLLGKLAMIELAGGGGYEFAAASSTGPCKCPHDPTRWAGGSSSGSGAATSAGCVGFAIGSETWGSIVTPAAFCGVTGVRPTYGRVPRTGAMALSWTMDKLGVLSRSAEDAAHVLHAIAGEDRADPSSIRDHFAFDTSLRNGLRFGNDPDEPPKFRLGILPHDYSRAPYAQKAFEEAVAVLKARGHSFKEAKYPADIPYGRCASTIIAAEGAASFENLLCSDKVNLLADTAQQAGLIAGLAIPAVDYLRALRIRTHALAALNRMWTDFDALIAPALLTEATPIDASLRRLTDPWGGNGGPGNLAGWPSITLPMGTGKSNLPLALELIGPALSEPTLLSLAIQFQRDTNHHTKTPPN